MAEQEGGEEESVVGMLSGLRLSDAERRGVKGTWLDAKASSNTEAQVVGKLFAEKIWACRWNSSNSWEDLVPN